MDERAPNRRVFVVEDEPLIAMELVDRLGVLGYEVTGTAARADDAEQAIVARVPDVVLADINLRGSRSGIELARDLRRQFPHLPIVFLTAYSDPDLLELAGGVQPDGYLVKPLNERDLDATLQVAVYKAAAERERAARLSESSAMHDKLLAVRREASLHRMAAGVAHTFSNEISVAVALIEFARDNVHDPARCVADLDAAATRLLALREKLSLLGRFAGGGIRGTERLDLGELVFKTCSLIGPALPETIQFSVHIGDSGVTARADEKHLSAAVGELVTNATEVMGDSGGEIGVFVERVSPDELRGWVTFPRIWEVGVGPYGCIGVRDTGPGLAADEVESAFAPFTSAKELGRGLGLAAVLATARSTGGCVAVETAPGEGATFRIVLPVEPG
jgi:signal transduction histidine kinase